MKQVRGTVKNIDRGLICAYRDITFQNLNICAVSDSELSSYFPEVVEFLSGGEENYHLTT